MLRRRRVESKKQHKKRLRKSAKTKPIPSLGAYNLSTTDQADEPIDCVVSNDDEFLYIYDKHTDGPISWRARFQKRRRNLFQRVDIDLESPGSVSQSSGDQSQYYNNDEDGFPFSPPGSTPHGRNSPAKGRSPPGKHTPTKSRRRGTFELASVSVENSILDHEQSPTNKLISADSKRHAALASASVRQQNTSTRSLTDPPHFPARKTQSFACCSFLGGSKPPGITMEEEQRLWREAIEHEIRGEQRVRRSADTVRDVDQIEVVPVNRDFQDDNHRADLKYAEMDGVGMVFAPAAVSPKRDPGGCRPHDQKPWWRQENWTDSSFRDTITETTVTSTGFIADQTCEDAKSRIQFHAARQAYPQDDTKAPSKSLLEQSRNARSQTFRGKRRGLRVDTSQLDRSRHWSTTANETNRTKGDDHAQHDVPNTEPRYTRPQSKGVSTAKLPTAVRHRPFNLAPVNIQPSSPSFLQQSLAKARQEREHTENHHESLNPYMEDTSFSDLDESLDQRIERLDQLKVARKACRHRHHAADAPQGEWIACKIYDATPAHSDLEHTSVTVSSLALPKLNHTVRTSPIGDMMDNEHDVVADSVHDDSLVNSDSDFSSVVHRIEMTHPTAETGSCPWSVRHVEIRETPEFIPPTNKRKSSMPLFSEESQQSSPVVLRGRPPYFGTNIPIAKAKSSTFVGLSRFNSIYPENVTETKKVLPGMNATTPIQICVDSEFIDETMDRILENDPYRHLDPPPQKKRSQLGQSTEPIIILSPVGYYGDPPVLKKTDGSPIRNARAQQMRNEDRPVSQNTGLETPSESKLQSDMPDVKEFENSRPELIDLMATLSPKKGKLGIQESSGVLLFRPTINIYSGRSSDAKSKQQQGTETCVLGQDDNEGGELIDPKSLGVKNESPSRRSTRNQKPNFEIRASDSECENIETPAISDARLGWFPNAAEDDDDDDDNMHWELQKLADSEMKLRKELEDVQQPNAAYKWKSHCQANAGRANGRSSKQVFHIATPCASSIQRNEHDNRSRIANYDDIRRRAMKAEDCKEQQIDLDSSEIIDLSFVDEDQVSLSPLTNQMSPKICFEVADPYRVGQDKDTTGPAFFDADREVSRNQYRKRCDLPPHTDPPGRDIVPKTSLVEICRADQDQAMSDFICSIPDSFAAGGGYVNPGRDIKNVETHDDTHRMFPFSQPENRIYNKGHVAELRNKHSVSSPHIYCYDKISAKRDFESMGSPLNPLRSQCDWNASENQSAFSSYKNIGVDRVDDVTLRDISASKCSRFESSEPDRTRNANILIDRELSWGAVEHLYKLTPSRQPSNHESFEILDTVSQQLDLFRSRHKEGPMNESQDGGDSEDMSMASGDARLLALLSRYHSPEVLERLMDSSDSELNTGNDDDTPPTSNTAFDPESVHRRNMLLVRHGFKQSSHVRSPRDNRSLSPSAAARKPSGQSNSSSKGEGNANKESTAQKSGSQLTQQQVNQLQIDTSSCLSPSTVCMSPASRLERLRKLQSRMIPGAREEQQSGPIKTSVEDFEEERKLPVTRRLLSGARQRASKSLRRQNGTLTSSVLPNPKSPKLLEKGQAQVSGAELSQNKLKKKNYGEGVSRDMLSIASSTDRSKELLHSMSATARSRHVAAAKPGSLLWEATAARESLLKK